MVSKNLRTKDLAFGLKKKARKERSTKSFERELFFEKVKVILDGGRGGVNKSDVKVLWENRGF